MLQLLARVVSPPENARVCPGRVAALGVSRKALFSLLADRVLAA